MKKLKVSGELSPAIKELFKQTDEILHYMWDPIQISGIYRARDEYYSYVPKIIEMLLKNDSEDSITDHLLEIEFVTMGLKPKTKERTEFVENRAELVAGLLLCQKESIFDEFSGEHS